MKTALLFLAGAIAGILLATHSIGAAQQPSVQSASSALLRDYESAVTEFRELLSTQSGFTRVEGEDMRDVTAFLLDSASARSGIPILDRQARPRLQSEFLAEATIWCWLPTVPPGIKGQYRAQILAIRRPLLMGAYARDVVSLASGTTQSIGEQVTVLVPAMGGPETNAKVAWAAFRKQRTTSSQLLELLRRQEVAYDRLLNITLLKQYLRIP